MLLILHIYSQKVYFWHKYVDVMKKVIILCLFSLSLSNLIGQEGPGGVGNSSNNILWLDASSLSLSNNDPVTTWADISGNGNDLSQATASRQPTFRTSQINGLPAVQFDGTNDFLSFNNHITTDAITFFIVYSKDVITENGVFTLENHILTDRNNLTYLRSVSPVQTHSVTKSIGSYSLVTGRTDEGGIGTSIDISNGNSLSSSTRNDLTSILSSRLGARFINPSKTNAFLDGDISEFIIFNEALNDAERNIVSEAIAAKYNLTSLSSLYDYEATHSNNVIGIGSESNGSNTSARGSDSLLISNASSLDVGDYYIIGNDGASFTTSLSVPVGITERWERVWRVGETGEAGTVTLEFFLGSNGFSAVNNYALLIESNDGDFSNGDVLTHTTGRSYSVANNSIKFTNVSLSDGDYFTIAEQNSAIVSNGSGPWKNTSTWSCGCIPGESDNASIQSPHVVTIDSNASILNLEILLGGTLEFSGSDTLRVFSGLNIASTFTSSTGTVATLSTSGTQNFSNTSGANVQFHNLYVNNQDGLSLTNGGWSIANNLQVSSGGMDVSSADSVVLLSDASSTSQILESMSNAFTGEFTIQRFIDSRNANYGNFSSPIDNLSVDELDDDLFLSGLTGGQDGNATVNGGGIFYSILRYDRSLDAHDTITDVNHIFETAQGYEIYLASSLTTFNATTIDVKGVPNSGTIPQTRIDRGWNMTGNPFHSFIAWDSVTKPTQVPESYYIFNTDNGSYDFFTGSGKPLIAPFQGFWLFRASGAYLFNFEENNKVSSSSSAFLRKKSNYFSLKLTDQQNQFNHKTSFKFGVEASSGYDEGDSPYLRSPIKEAPAIYSTIDAEVGLSELALNFLNPLESSHVLPLTIEAGTTGDFNLSSDGILSLLNDYSCVYLEDKKENKLIDLSVENNYAFTSHQGKEERFNLILSNSYLECEKALEEKGSNQKLDYSLSLRNSGQQWNLDYQLSEQSTQIEVQLLNTRGQQVISPFNFSVSHSGTYHLRGLNDLKGIYIIRVISNNQIINKTIKL